MTYPKGICYLNKILEIESFIIILLLLPIIKIKIEEKYFTFRYIVFSLNILGQFIYDTPESMILKGTY